MSIVTSTVEDLNNRPISPTGDSGDDPGRIIEPTSADGDDLQRWIVGVNEEGPGE